jgi:hypothetical protein
VHDLLGDFHSKLIIIGARNIDGNTNFPRLADQSCVKHS